MKKTLGDRRVAILAAFMALALLASLAPLLWASFYAHPAWDDFRGGLFVHQALEAGGGVGKIISAAARNVADAYRSWQGTFAAPFMTAFMPAVFSEGMYFLAPFLVIGTLVISVFCLMDALVVRWLKGRRSWAVLLTSAMLICQIEFVPDKREAFYWYSGTVNYTFFFGLSLFLAAIVVRILLDRGQVRAPRLIAALLLALAVGGGNYTTALVSAELLALAVLVAARVRNAAWKQLVPVLALLLAALIVSVVAPGNAVRAAAAAGAGQSPPVAVYHAIRMMLRYIGQWTHLPQVTFLALAAPFLYFMSLRCSWSFRWPLGACALAVLLSASQLAPTYYGLGFPGAGRQIDIYYYAHYFTLLFCEFYLCGWFARRGVIDSGRAKALCGTHFLACCVLLGALFFMGCGGQVKEMTSVEIALSLRDGEPQRFDAEYNAWVDELRAAKGTDLTIREVVAPAYFAGPEIEEDPTDWKNTGIAEYYGLNSIAELPAGDAQAPEGEVEK